MFLGKLELFRGLKIESLWQDTEQFYVLHLDFSAMNRTSVEAFDIAFNNALDKFILKHNIVINVNTYNLASAIINCDKALGKLLKI